MSKTNTVHVMKKEVETLQQQIKILTREVADLKLKVSPDSAVPSEVHVGEETESSETVETLLKTDQEVIEKRLETVEERLEALQSSLAERSQGLQPDKLIDEMNEDGKTQLSCAVGSRDIVKVTMLLKRGADVNLGESDGYSPLHEAARSGFTDVCALLLLMGNADLNAKDEGGNTPLHLAAHEGHIDVVDLLLKCGADVNVKCSDGNTACDDAIVQEHTEVARLLDCAFNRDMFASSLNQPLTK